MSLTERLDGLAKEAEGHSYSGEGCKLIRIVNSDKFTDAERVKFLSILDVPSGKIGRVTSASLGKLLRSEGFNLSDRAIERHRAGTCGCDLTAGASK